MTKPLEELSDDELAGMIAKNINPVQKPPQELESLSNDDLANILINQGKGRASASAAEAALSSFGQQASFGYLPQLQARAGEAIQALMPKSDVDKQLEAQGFRIQNAPDKSYLQLRDQAISEQQRMVEDQPLASMAGGLAGGLTSGIATGGALGKVLGVGGRAATVAGRLKQGAAAGAASGLVRNPGDTEGEVSMLQPGERLKTAASDAATGAIFQGGLEGLGKIGKALKDAPETIKNYSQISSLKASGAMLKDFRKAFGKNKVKELGQSMIDNGVVGIGDDIADIAKKAAAAKQVSGEAIGEIYKAADSKGTINSSEVKRLIQDYGEETANKLRGTIQGEQAAEKIGKVLDTVSEADLNTFSGLKKIRASIDDEINFAKQTQDLPIYQAELLALRNKMQDFAKEKMSPALKNKFIRENKNFSNLAEVERIASDKLARESSNAAFGLRERISGGIGAGVGAGIGGSIAGPAGAAIGAVAGGLSSSAITKASRQYGTPFVAITANKIAKKLEENPKALGKFSDSLIKAANISPKEFVTSVNLMMKEPEFKKYIGNNND